MTGSLTTMDCFLGQLKYGHRNIKQASKNTNILNGTANIAIEDDFKMLKWSDETLNGDGYIDWYEFEHPQLRHSGTRRLGYDVLLSVIPPPQLS